MPGIDEVALYLPQKQRSLSIFQKFQWGANLHWRISKTKNLVKYYKFLGTLNKHQEAQ